MTIYFPLDVTRCVVARIARSLRPGGYFFLGHAETLRGISNSFHLHHTHETFYYQRREAVDEPGDLLATMKCVALSAARPGTRTAPPTGLLDSQSEVREIRGRDSRQSRRLPIPHCGQSRRSAVARAAAAAPALELLRRERFVEAKEFLQGLPPGSAADPDAQILLAVLHANSGEITEAEKIARQCSPPMNSTPARTI